MPRMRIEVRPIKKLEKVSKMRSTLLIALVFIMTSCCREGLNCSYYPSMGCLDKEELYWPYILSVERQFDLQSPLNCSHVPEKNVFRFSYRKPATLNFARKLACSLAFDYKQRYGQICHKEFEVLVRFICLDVGEENKNSCMAVSVEWKQNALIYHLKKGSGGARWQYTETFEEAARRADDPAWENPDPKKLINLPREG